MIPRCMVGAHVFLIQDCKGKGPTARDWRMHNNERQLKLPLMRSASVPPAQQHRSLEQLLSGVSEETTPHTRPVLQVRSQNRPSNNRSPRRADPNYIAAVHSNIGLMQGGRGNRDLRQATSLPAVKVARYASIDVPLLPPIATHGNTMKYPLASEYFTKWKHPGRFSLAESLGRNAIEEDSPNTDEHVRDSACFGLLSRFPSSAEFCLVLHDVCKSNN